MATSSSQSQERLAGALAYILFFIPMLMRVRTDFSMFHAKQSFMLLLVEIIISLIGSILYFIPFFATAIWLLITVIIVWCVYQAYMGNRFALPVLSEYTDRVITTLKLTELFATK